MVLGRFFGQVCGVLHGRMTTLLIYILLLSSLIHILIHTSAAVRNISMILGGYIEQVNAEYHFQE